MIGVDKLIQQSTLVTVMMVGGGIDVERRDKGWEEPRSMEGVKVLVVGIY